MSVFAFLSALLRHWKLVVLIPLVVVGGTVIWVLAAEPKYEAIVRFVPEGRQDLRLPSAVAGLASELGIFNSATEEPSPEFYVQLLQTREILEGTLSRRYAAPLASADRDSSLLIEILVPDLPPGRERMERGRRLLARSMSINTDLRTGIINTGVLTPDPDLSAAVANDLVVAVGVFNLETRQSAARRTREFVEQRLKDAADGLREAEEDLKTFRQRNVGFRAPELQLEHDRIEREVVMRAEVVSALRREFEQARIKEVNDVPVITVIENAVPPVRPSRPRRATAVVLAALLGGAVGVFCAVGAEYIVRRKNQATGELEDLRRDWARFWAPFGRTQSGS